MSDQDNPKNLISINSICSLLIFSGNNVLDFLNNLLISNLTVLTNNTYHYSALCNPKGRIIASLWLNIIDEQQIKLICPSNMQENLIHFFNMRKFRLKIDINLSNEKIIVNTDDLSIFTTDTIHDDITSASVEKFYGALFNKNLPWIDFNNTEKFIPQHVNLDLHDDIMSFSKGCYPGQEIIARIKYLGTIKKRMVLASDDNEKVLYDSIDKHQQVSPIIYQKSKNKFTVQLIDTIK